MRQLAELLYKLPADRLRAIAVTRELDAKKLAAAHDKRRIADIIAAEIAQPASVKSALNRCNAQELRLLQLLLSLPGQNALSWNTVVELAGGSDVSRAISRVFQGIESLGLALRLGDRVHVVDSVRALLPVSLADKYTLAHCLDGYDAQTIRRIAESYDTVHGAKASNIKAIVAHLTGDNGAVKIEDPAERSVIDFLLQAGGYAPALDVASAVLGSTDDFYRYEWQNRWKTGRSKNAIDRLLARGMIFVVSQSYGYNLFLLVPGDLLRVIAGDNNTAFWVTPPPALRRLASAPSSPARHMQVVRDIITFFAAISVQEVAPTNTGSIHRTFLKNVARQLSLQSDRYSLFLYALCRTASLIVVDPERGRYVIGPVGRAWLRHRSLRQLRTLLDAWAGGDLWAEMFDEPLKRNNEYRSLETIVMLRTSVMNTVAQSESETFTEIGSLMEALTFRHPMILGQNGVFAADQASSPARFVRTMVGECLYWLGLAELVVGPGGDVESILGYRLTREGAFLLGAPDAVEPEEQPVETGFILQANAEIFIPPYLTPLTLLQLLLLTETPAKASVGNVVSLTRDSIRRAIDMGMSGKQLLEFLQAHAKTGVPQNVEYLIKEVAGKHGHIHVGKARMYIQVDSPILLTELQARRDLKGHFVRNLSETVAIVDIDDTEKLLKDLRKHGYLPISDDVTANAGFLAAYGDYAEERTSDRNSQSNSEERRAPPDLTQVDWDRIARDDTASMPQPIFAGASQMQPSDAIRDKINIRNYLLQAVEMSHRVEFSYQKTREAAPVPRLMDPIRVMGNFVVGYLPIENEEGTFNIGRIVWVRPAGENLSAE